ncbi:MAG: ABC transporter ATP-binding protein [Acidimicrobiia bacterium]
MSYLSVEALSVRYGRVWALHQVSLEVERGSVVAVLGRNGAGKSSLLRAVAGLVRPAAGRVSWNGHDLTRLPADRRARLGMVMIPEGRRIFPGLTVRENLLLGGFGLGREEVEGALGRVLELFPFLAERSRSPAGQLSGGQQQILALGRVLMVDPQMLLLDEPSLGLAPKVVDDIYGQLRLLREAGKTILLVEQHVGRALGFADEALVLNLGRVVLRDRPERLSADPRLFGAYMGERSR